MNLFNPISTIMTKGVITLTPNESIAKAGELFESKRIHHLPIVDAGKLVGMVSKSDYLLFKRGFNTSPQDDRIDRYRLSAYAIKDIMTTGLATLEASDRINVALEVFKENLFHALPVTEDGVLVGIVTTFDIINNLAVDGVAEAKY